MPRDRSEASSMVAGDPRRAMRGLVRRRRPARRARSVAAFVAGLAVLASLPLRAEEARALPEPLVYLRDIEPTILQDIRYAGTDNFTGRPVPGYDAGECVLLREAAEALARVQQALAARNLSLKVYDCYRPRRAVRAFVAWVREGGAGLADPLLRRFHPNLDRGQLIEHGYLSAVSHHSLGNTVDVTLVELPAKPT